MALFALAAAGCNAHQQALPNMQLPVANEMPLGSSSNDVWTTFAYNFRRSGFNPNVTNLKKSNVSRLEVRWKRNLGDKIYASPVIYADNLVVATEGSWGGNPDSVVYDLNPQDGHLIWKYTIAGRVKSTPAIDPDAGLVIVGDQTSGSSVFALRLLDGSLAWQTRVKGRITAAPVVAGGSVYVGRAGGDPPECTQGGVTAINESTGQVVWNWYVDPKPKEGGSVWGAIAYDGTHLIFGTGNTCEQPITTANGAVSLSLDGKIAWNLVAVKDSHHDADTGGGVMVYREHAHFINKNGRFYSVDKETGTIAWKIALNAASRVHNWSGGFATPSTDGTTIIEGSGFYKDAGPGDAEFCVLDDAKPAEVQPGYHSELHGMNLSGDVLWTRRMQNRLVGYVALTGGMGFVGLNKAFFALDLTNGKTLWKHPAADYIAASMVLVPSGLYGADEAGNVYRFALSPS